jgi:hypothetical protein
VPETSAVDLLAVAFAALRPEEQEAAFSRLAEMRLRRLAGEESDTARMIRSLQCVADEVGRAPSVDDYRRVAPLLRAAGEDVEPLSRLQRHFGGSYRRAVEALALSEVTTARRIQARFDSRRVGKVWKYTEGTLRDTLARCAEHYGHVPQIAEFEWWRDRELELAQGNDTLHLPSATPYRKRWRTWEGALVHFGYSREEIDRRLEPGGRAASW